MVCGDLLDKNLLEKTTENVDAVYHFAAIAGISEANENSYDALNVNIMGTVNLINACIKNKVKRFLFASSVYVNSKKGGIYSISKRTCEDLIENATSNGLNWTVLRYGSLYGLRAGKENGIYKIANALISAKEKCVFDESGDEIREYVNVTDAAVISANCLGDEYFSKTLTITGIERFKIKEIVAMIAEMLGKKDIKIEFTGRDDLHYSMTPYQYSQKMSEKIINNPYIDIGQGIFSIIEDIKKGQAHEV
jgi:UDP-glucose 4-epimerase